MTHFMCRQCGVQFAASDKKPSACPICEDERQYVRWAGQAWTTMAELGRDDALCERWDVENEKVPVLIYLIGAACARRVILGRIIARKIVGVVGANG